MQVRAKALNYFYERAQWLHHLERPFALFDELPEAFGLAEDFVFSGAAEVAAEEEILNGVLVEHAVDADMTALDGEVYAVVASAAAIELGFGTGEDAKFFCEAFFLIDLVGQDVQGFQQRELGLRGQIGEFGGTDFIENDLKHEGHLSENSGHAKRKQSAGISACHPLSLC